MKKLLTKIGMILTALVIGLSSLIQTMPVYALDTLYESSETAENALNGSGWQTFTPSITHTITSVSIEACRWHSYEANQTVTLEIKATAGGVPTGAALCSGDITTSTYNPTFVWKNATLSPSNIVLTAGTTYAVTWTAAEPDIFLYATDIDGIYAGGRASQSVTHDNNFREYGTYAGVPFVTTTAATGVTDTTAILNGTLEIGLEDDVDVYFGWRKDGGALYEYYTPYQTCAVPSPIAHSITGLLPGQKYYYRIFAHDRPDTVDPDWEGTELDFTTETALAVETHEANYITSGSAVLNGEVTDMGVYATADVGFEWGETTAYEEGFQDAFPDHLDVAGVTLWGLTGLTPGETYHFRFWADGGDGKVYGADKSFVAYDGGYIDPLAVTTVAADDITDTTVTLNADLTAIGRYAPHVGFQYGTAIGSWTQINLGEQDATGVYDYALAGLEEGQDYVFQAWAYDQDTGARSDQVRFGAIMAFHMTGDYAPLDLTVVTNGADYLGENKYRLNGTLTGIGGTSAVVRFQYGKTLAYDHSTSPKTRTVTGPFQGYTLQLDGDTTYHYRAIATDGIGTTVYGADMTIGTEPGPTFEPTGTVIPIPPAPGGWGETGWHYFLLIICLVVAPLFMMFIIGGKIGKFLSILINIAIFAAWLMVGWIEIYGIILTCLAAGAFLFQLIRPKAA